MTETSVPDDPKGRVVENFNAVAETYDDLRVVQARRRGHAAGRAEKSMSKDWSATSRRSASPSRNSTWVRPAAANFCRAGASNSGARSTPSTLPFGPTSGRIRIRV